MELQNLPEPSQKPVVILPINKVQSYAWGRKDKNCLVGSLAQEPCQAYAEFWMGTHPNGQSKLDQEKSLKQYLNQNGVDQIQFLFKILSIQKCLSIQAHPNQEEAKQLHQAFPQIYVDDKDKPQMLLTLSDEFELFLGFVTEQELEVLTEIQPFKSLNCSIGKKQHSQRLLSLLQKLVRLSQLQLKQNIQTLLMNLELFEEKRQKITRRIFDEFWCDTGILVSCILQLHILKKGACLGIQSGVPHAYIRGECFELMKNSDNVVRLGLTPKNKDIPNLLKIIKNNIANTYCQIKQNETDSETQYEWKQYTIRKLKLTNQKRQFQIHSNSIGISIESSALIFLHQTNNLIVEIQPKNVFFIHEGTYLFQGQGQIYIATKA